MAYSDNNFAWTDERKNRMNAAAHDQAAALRVARRVLKLVGPQGAYVDSVAGHRVDSNTGNSLGIRPNQHLQPIQISRSFHLFREQANDDESLQFLVERAGADLALGEDGVILLGSGAGPLLKQLRVDLDNPTELPEQEGLFDDNQPEVPQPTSALDSILAAIERLRSKGQFGDYRAIVSPILYREAYTPRQSPLDAPIYQICGVPGLETEAPLIRKEWFLYSEAAQGRRGVVFSLARRGINLAVPMDTYVERVPDDEKGQPRFKVCQQFRLIIDDAAAKEPLT